MNLKVLRQLLSLRDLRNAAVGLVVVIAGLGLALLTLWAHRTGDARLAGIAAAASLVLVLLIIVFVIPPLARSASAEAAQMNLPFEFTTGGAIFLGLFVIVGFSAWNTGNNLLFLVLAFLVSTLFVSFVVGSFALKKIDVKMRFPETIFASEATPILISLHNRKRIFPSFSVVVEVRGRERENSAVAAELEKILPVTWARKIARPPLVKHTLGYFLHLPRRAVTEEKIEYIFPRRGRYVIHDFELTTRFPFAFFRHRRRLPAQETQIFIFPKIEHAAAELTDLPLETGKLVATTRGAGQDLLALRDYQPHDDLRRVDWKATARSRRIIVREFAAEDEKRVTVIFDSRLRLSAKEKKKTLRSRIEDEQYRGKKLSPAARRFEKGVEQTAALLAHFNNEKAELRLFVDGKSGSYSTDAAHFYDNLKSLAVVEPQFIESAGDKPMTALLEEILDEKISSHIFLITSQGEKNLPPEIVPRVKIIRF